MKDENENENEKLSIESLDIQEEIEDKTIQTMDEEFLKKEFQRQVDAYDFEFLTKEIEEEIDNFTITDKETLEKFCKILDKHEVKLVDDTENSFEIKSSSFNSSGSILFYNYIHECDLYYYDFEKKKG